MGCDIHDYLEVRRDGRWEYAGDEAFPENEYDWERHSPFDGARSYALFGFLADVRNYSDITPISPPRGLPHDVSADVAAKDDGMRDWWHSRTWLTLAELLAYDYDQTIEDRRDARETVPVSKGQKMSLREFLGDWYFDRLELCKRFGDPEDVRIIMWFDN